MKRFSNGVDSDLNKTTTTTATQKHSIFKYEKFEDTKKGLITRGKL